jgi:hypothetical protein
LSSHLIGTLLAILGVVCFSIRPVLVKVVYATASIRRRC